MTVSIEVTCPKDTVYKPPPPTVATPAATTATAAAILAFPTTQTPFHFVVKDLLQKQRLVLSWSSLRWVISRGIYPSSTFLTTPGSTSLPELFSTKPYSTGLPIKKNPTTDSPPTLQQSEVVLESPTTPNIHPPARPIPQDIPETNVYQQQSAIEIKVDQATNSTDNDILSTPTPSSLDIATGTTEEFTNETMDATKQQENHMIIEAKDSSLVSQQQHSLAAAAANTDVDAPLPTTPYDLRGVTTVETDHHYQEGDINMMETNDAIEYHQGSEAVTLSSDDQSYVQQLQPISTRSLKPVSSSNSTYTILPDESSSPAPVEMEPTSSTVSVSMESSSSTVSILSTALTSMESTPMLSESASPTTIMSMESTSSTTPESSYFTAPPPIDSKALLPRPESNTPSAIERAPPPPIVDSKALLPRPRSKTPLSDSTTKQSSTTTPADARRSSPISSKTPLPRPPTTVLANSSSTGHATPPLRNSNPPMPLKRNSKLPIRASSSTPSGLLSSKRPAASPTINKRRAIPSLFSPTNPTPMPTHPPSKNNTTNTTPTSNKTGLKSTGTSSPAAARTMTATPTLARGNHKPMLTKMDHIIQQDANGDDDDEEEEERPKPISRKEKLARQAKRAEQIKFYRVREEREAREQRLASRRRLMATRPRSSSSNNNNKIHIEDDFSDSGSSNLSSTSASGSAVATSAATKQRKMRTKGVKFNLNRNRVIEIRGGDTLDDQVGSRSTSSSSSSSRRPHSVR